MTRFSESAGSACDELLVPLRGTTLRLFLLFLLNFSENLNTVLKVLPAFPFLPYQQLVDRNL